VINIDQDAIYGDKTGLVYSLTYKELEYSINSHKLAKIEKNKRCNIKPINRRPVVERAWPWSDVLGCGQT